MLKHSILVASAAVVAYVGHAYSSPVQSRDSSDTSLKYIFSFGNSYTSSGYNPSGPFPSVNCTLGNPNCVTGNTECGGFNWITSLTNEYNRSLTLTYNFAVSGYVVDSDYVPGRQGIKQVEFPAFEQTVATKPSFAPWEADNTLFSTYIGINDVGATFNVQDDDETFFDEEFDSYFGMMEQAYNYGGRNFLFVSVPPTWRTPMFSTLNATDHQKLVAAVQTWNDYLDSRMDDFQDAHSDVKLYFWDSFQTFSDILDDPNQYGFADNTSICDTGDCVWHDSYHPSSTAQQMFGKLVSDILADGGFW